MNAAWQPSRPLSPSPRGLLGVTFGLITMQGNGRSPYWQLPGVLSAVALTKAVPERGLPNGSLTVKPVPGAVRGPTPEPQLIPGVAPTRAAVSRG